MSKDLRWVHWWVCPWKNAHPDWCAPPGFVDIAALSHSQHHQVSHLFGITPELPPRPSAPVLQLVLSRVQQRDLVLMLVNEVCNPTSDSRLSEDQRLWCQRLAKALAPEATPLEFEDPLHCLRAWVSPATWQRLRLSFARPRVLELEKFPRLVGTNGRLDTLWQAALWRATSTLFNETPRLPP